MANKQFFIYVHLKPNGDPFYVGKGIYRRANSLEPRNPHHRNILLKYGTDNISIQMFACEDEQHALQSEVALIAQLRSLGFVLANMTDGGEGVSGYRFTPEQRKNLSITHVGKPPWNKGKKTGPLSAETIAKRTASVIGSKRSAETCAKISAANKGQGLGRKLSKTTRQKIGAALRGKSTGRGRKLSEEHKNKIRGYHHTADAKARIGAASVGRNTGLIRSSETRAKMKASAIAYWASQRERKVD